MTKNGKIYLQLYNQLLFICYSPVTALNRTYALSKIKGKQAAIEEAEKLGLTNNHLYHVLLGIPVYRQRSYESKSTFKDRFETCKNGEREESDFKRSEEAGANWKNWKIGKLEI